ncbi:hypothetical protein V8E55_003448 [Tylopilus felleus]
MLFSITSFLRKFHGSYWLTDPEEQHPSLSQLATELDDLRRFSLNSLMALLAGIAVSGSKTLQPMVLALLIYTISLRIAINSSFLRNHPTSSRCLHAVPLLGTSCMAGIALVSDSQSPVLAILGLFLGVLPLVTIAVHQARLCGDALSPVTLPVRIQDVSERSATSGAADTTGTLASD